MNEQEAFVILNNLPGIGPVKIRMLVEHFGSAQLALQADLPTLSLLSNFSQKAAETVSSWQQYHSWEEDLDLIKKYQVEIIPYTDPRYPKRLRELSDFPVLLYVRGNLSLLNQASIAVIGTRNATLYGKEMATKISQELTNYGFTVTSGLARGIDTAAHWGALANGQTIAVIGSGLANIYPRENLGLSESIIKKGALISQFPMNTKPDRQNFPQRNRIVSGMTIGSTLIEAPKKSGAMITMQYAFNQNRKTFALPGRVDISNFNGNHHLLKNGKTLLIENAKDIADAYNNLFSQVPHTPKKPLPTTLETEEQLLLNQLPNYELTIDEIATQTKLPITKLNVLLMRLVLKKILKEFPGKIYKRIF